MIVSSAHSRPRWIGRWFLRLLIGHGYRPWLTALWALPIIAAFAIIVAANSAKFVPERSPTPAGHATPDHAEAVGYSVDTFLPIVDLGQANLWAPTGWVQWLEWLVVLAGWALSALFVAGFTRIVRT